MNSAPKTIAELHDDWEQVRAAYEDLLTLAMDNCGSSRDIAALLLNTYNWNLEGTGFMAGRFRHLDADRQTSVLRYLAWLGGGAGRYPPDDDMERLLIRWVQMGWNKPDHLYEQN